MRRTSGISLMLLIFLSLSLIIFSLLSLSEAVADRTLSNQAAERTRQYYAAVTEANALISRIDAALARYLREADTAEAFSRLCSQMEEEFTGVSWENGTFSFSVDVDETQILQVEADVSWPSSDEDSLYRVRSWKIINTDDWTANHSMNLFRTETEA